MIYRLPIFLCFFLLAACEPAVPPNLDVAPQIVMTEPRPEIYADFTLSTDLSRLSDDQRAMIMTLIDASKIMDELFWHQAFGDDHVEWLDSIDEDKTRRFAEINYGPWDRLNDEAPFIAGYGQKPPGANFYPTDMSVEEFEAVYLPGKTGAYSLIRRDDNGKLIVRPYHRVYAEQLNRAAELLHEAADLAESAQFATYLKLRAAALLSDEFQTSDLYWMDVKDNDIDIVIGPIETYEDRLFGYRTAYQASVLLKDLEWSERLSRFAAFLPELQKALPVPAEYKSEAPGTDSDLNAYDVIYTSGYSNAGTKSIAINLPNDEVVQLERGTRRLQLKNAMRAKFDKILEPIADTLIADNQRQHITFDAFFANAMFHEVAHGLGVKNTIDGKGTVRDALKDVASSMEEGKADVLGLFMITQLHDRGDLGDVDLRDYYVTFMAGIFRSVRFGASSAHGKANMVRFNFFKDAGAFVRDPETGKYSADFDAMRRAMADLSGVLLTLQGDGDYAGAVALTDSQGVIPAELDADLARLSDAEIPVDIRFVQGPAELGLD